VWVVIDRKGAKARPNLGASDVAEEALCFGWIDSLPRKRDAANWMLYVAPRRPRSVWSSVNKRRLERLLAEGRLAPAGLAAAERARADGSWSAMDRAEALEVPPDLEAALRRAPAAARAGWDGFPPSARRGLLGWISLARRPATRAARIERTVSMAAGGRPPRLDGGRPLRAPPAPGRAIGAGPPGRQRTSSPSRGPAAKALDRRGISP
jgi:uncharacterized protein YdeI (YjbR/CyaY-like superfamily)